MPRPICYSLTRRRNLSSCSYEAGLLRVLTLSTLFPDAARPRLGPFVERQTLGLAAHPNVALRVIAPIGLPPWPLKLHPHYRPLANLPEREMWKGLHVHRPRFFHLPGSEGRFDTRALTHALKPVLADIRKDFAFDIIDAEFFFPDGPAAAALGRTLGVPVSIKARGGDIHYWGEKPALRDQMVAAGKSASGLLAVSEALKADMVAMGMPENRVAVHRTGIDLSLFTIRDRAVEKARLGIAGPLIATIGALVPRKRQHLIIEALAHLPDARLVLIGDGPERARLAAQARAVGVEDRVIFTGSIGHEEIARWLAAADVMSLASVSEGLANAWIEALACGTPIVITDVGGAREVVDTPYAGRISSPGAAALAAEISELLANPPPREATRAVAARFSWETNRDQLYRHLDALVSG
jgi:teichuronic acid biosynthesis glycosyltransferase TuaC